MTERITISIPDGLAKRINSRLEWGDNRSEWFREAAELKLRIDEGDQPDTMRSESESEQREEDEETEHAHARESADYQDIIEQWRPGRDAQERQEIQKDALEGVEWLREQNGARSRSDFIAELYSDEIDVAADSWWRKRVRRGLEELVKDDLVEQDGRKWRWVGD